VSQNLVAYDVEEPYQHSRSREPSLRRSSDVHASKQRLLVDPDALRSTSIPPEEPRRHRQRHDLSSIRSPSYHRKSVHPKDSSSHASSSGELRRARSLSSEETVVALESGSSRRMHSQGSQSTLASDQGDKELNNFVNSFRSMVTQFSEETQDGADIATEDRHKASGSGQHLKASVELGEEDDDGENDRYGYDEYEDEFESESPMEYRSQPHNDRRQTWYYDDFGRPVLVDPKYDYDRVELLGGLVHRMSTIESVGSSPARSKSRTTKQDSLNSPTSASSFYSVPSWPNIVSKHPHVGSSLLLTEHIRSSSDAQTLEVKIGYFTRGGCCFRYYYDLLYIHHFVANHWPRY
jgi:hypothetical protein